MIPDQVVRLHEDGWSVFFNGSLLPAIWPDKGSALAGLATARNRYSAPNPPLPSDLLYAEYGPYQEGTSEGTPA